MGLKPIFTVILLLWVSGCTSIANLGPQPLSEAQRQNLGRVLVQASYESTESTSGITTGKGAGAAKGAGIATGEWLGASLSTGEPITAMVGILLTPVVTVAGGVYGGVVADRAEDVRDHQVALQKVLDATSQAYERQLGQQLADLRYVDTVISNDLATPHQSRLVVNFRELQGTGGGPRSDLEFTLLTETKLYTNAGGVPDYVRNYRVTSDMKRLSDWVENDGAPLSSAIDQLAYTTVANILDDHFRSSSYLVEPVFPAKRFVFKPQRLTTVQPTFRWRLAEGRRELAVGEHTGLTYALRVVDDTGRAYEVDALLAHSFQFADALPDCSTFSWQVRADYEVFGQPRSTPWSEQRQFRTPCSA